MNRRFEKQAYSMTSLTDKLQLAVFPKIWLLLCCHYIFLKTEGPNTLAFQLYFTHFPCGHEFVFSPASSKSWCQLWTLLRGVEVYVLFLQIIHKCHSLLKWTLYNSRIRKTCWLFKSLFFSFSSLSPIYFIAGLAVSVYVFLCMNEHVLVISCQDICSLLHLSVVCGIGGELEWLYEML